MTNPAKATPISNKIKVETTSTPLTDRAKQNVKHRFESAKKNPTVRWAGNTIIGVFEAGCRQMLFEAVASPINNKVRLPRI